MRERLSIGLTGAFLALLPAGTAYPADENPAKEVVPELTPEQARALCLKQLMNAEKRVNAQMVANALDDAKVEEVNLYLDELDAACADDRFKRATKILGKVNVIVAPDPEPALPAETAAPVPPAEPAQ